MKENRNGFIFTAVLSFIGLVIAVVTCFISWKCANWLQNLGFALFGSAFISAIICLINYLTLRRKMFDDISKCYDKLIVATSILRYNLPLQKEQSITNYYKDVEDVQNLIQDAYWKSQEMFNVNFKEKICKKIMYQLVIECGSYKNYINSKIHTKFTEEELKNVNLYDYDTNIKYSNYWNILKLIKQWDEVVYSKKTLKIKQENREFVEKVNK